MLVGIFIIVVFFVVDVVVDVVVVVVVAVVIEFGWVVVCKVIIMSNPTQLS